MKNYEAMCVCCEEEITETNGPEGTYDGQFRLCGPCGERVRPIQAVAKATQSEVAYKRNREDFQKKYPSLVR
jgi:hypothetical protein